MADKIIKFYPEFDQKIFIESIKKGIKYNALKQRVELMADKLHLHIPDNNPDITKFLLYMLGPGNLNET